MQGTNSAASKPKPRPTSSNGKTKNCGGRAKAAEGSGVKRPAEVIDSFAGEAIDRILGTRHRRRLTRVGRLEQLAPPADGSPWAARDPPPREGNDLEGLIDGGPALERIAEALAAARSYVHIAGWHPTPDFRLTRDHAASRLRDVLAELAERVEGRVLLWAGSPLPLFSPDRSDVRAVREELLRGSRVQCGLDARERPMHCHHEKLVILDAEIAFVGGIDLPSRGGDRFDSVGHPARGQLGWHDASSRLRGPAVADVASHFAMRWQETTGEELTPGAAPAPAGGGTVQVVRTI